MKIAYVVPYVPSLVRVRPYNLIRSLVHRGNELTVFTLWSNERDQAELEDLKGQCQEVIALPMPRWRSLVNSVMALPTNTPLQAVYSWNPNLAFQIENHERGNTGGSFDVIHIEHLRGARYGLHLHSRRPELPIVWDSVDCISYLFAQAAGQSRSLLGRLMTKFELGRTRRYESRLPGTFDHVLMTSAIDRKALLDLVPAGSHQSPVSIIPNGVDLAYFQAVEPVERDPATVVFSGKMSYHANITMALYLSNEVMPMVWRERPDVRLAIVGKDPSADVLALASNPAITVTGFVEDIRPSLHRATVAAVPLIYGAGIQNKLLEAMACGTPVVATSRAVAALEVQPGRDLLVADEAEGFARRILQLINDPQSRVKIGEAGKAYVEKNHHWGNIAASLERIYHGVVDSKGWPVTKESGKSHARIAR